MEQKRVSFKVAKAIKEAGYPQEWNDTEYYYTENGELKRCDDYEGNSIENIMYNQRYAVPAPFALDVWLWLWREKKKRIHTRDYYGGLAVSESSSSYDSVNYSDPEEAIIAAIEYLVDNDLLK